MNGGTISGFIIGLALMFIFIVWVLSLFGYFYVDPNILLYIAYCVIVGVSGTGIFANNGQYVTAVMFLIGALFVFVWFGLRWFYLSGIFSSNNSVVWPPYINTCPDYLYYYKRNGNTDTCVDPLGVSTNNGIQKLPPGPINDSNNNYFFTLTPGMDKGQTSQTAGLTWEGINDGVSTNITPSQNNIPINCTVGGVTMPSINVPGSA